jgi:hypothetical protein
MNTIYSALLILLLFYFLLRKQIRIKRWQNSLKLQEHSQAFYLLYQNVDGFILSHQARQKQDAVEYVYGEIEFFSFIALLSLAQPNTTTVFYDLGSGIGKAVLACAMVYPVHKSVGVEFLPELYNSACTQTKKLIKIPNYTDAAKKIEFILGNFLEVSLQDATFIFINATTFIGSIWENLCSRLDSLPQLITVITTGKALISHNFLVIKSTKLQMSWGVVYAYIHIRKTNYH